VSVITLLELNYSVDLLAHYQKLSTLPGFVLLESSDKVAGRYDIVSACPYLLRNSGKDIFQELQALPGSEQSSLDLPFQGGAIGYFSYDLGANLAGVDSSAQTTLHHLPLFEVGLYDWALIADHHLKKVTLFAANTQPETAGIVEEVLSLWNTRTANNPSFVLQTPFKPLISKADYKTAFDAIYQDLLRGRSYQVNYTQPFNAHYRGDAFAMYCQIRAKNPVPFSAFLGSTAASILSFSPERFLLMDKGTVLTSPIKGTAGRAACPFEDARLRSNLLNCAKNKAENVMIVDLLRNDLGKIAKPGSVVVEGLCEVESYQAVHHLVSHIKAQCQERLSPVEVFAACFPGGSITGAPKRETMHLIAEQEPFARGVYCGSIGYFSRHGRSETNIAIRTITACEETLHLGAGGGIIIDSNWEAEYLECFTKIAAIVNGLS
jgi:para-aminobenzoate synthetase component 1